MKAQEDFSISREVKVGFLIFLKSERLRHYDDIQAIDKAIKEVYKQIDATVDEIALLDKMAERYRKF